LYFEELSYERVKDIYEQENAISIVVSVGDQLSQNNTAYWLSEATSVFLPLHPVVITKFISGASEIDVDAINKFRQ
ncbi:15649_t:CDS:2, partial [Entrophospora sp. SA101]